MSVRLTMACGCVVTIAETETTAICSVHDERRVQAVKASAPRFRGVCLGPLARYESLPGLPVVVGVNDDQ